MAIILAQLLRGNNKKMLLIDYRDNLKYALDKLDIDLVDSISNLIYDTIANKSRIFFCGNGGSAANPSHSTGDWSKELGARTHCLTDNIASLTAWANDTDYSNVFVGQLETFYEDADILLAFSGSGNSPNVINALNFVNNKGGTTIGFTGNYNGGKGGKLSQLSKFSLVFNTESMEIIEDLQLITCHMIKQTVKAVIF